MKKFMGICIVAVVLAMLLMAGCGTPDKSVKHALKTAITVGQEIELMERDRCPTYDDCPQADRVAAYVAAGQMIYDANDIDGNCSMMLAAVDVARSWVIEQYPDKEEYRIVLAVLRVELEFYCGEGQ